MFHVYALAGSTPSSVSVALPLNEMTSPARKELPSWGERIVATGALPALIVTGVEMVVFVPSETVSLALNRPACVYVCVGFAAVEVVPSPNVQAYVNGCPSGSDEPAL